MEFINIKSDEEYEIRCGEIYLNLNRQCNIHCTLCEKIFNEFEMYVEHIERKHQHFDNNMQRDSKLSNKDDAFMIIMNDDSSSDASETEMEDIKEYTYEALDEYMSPSTSNMENYTGNELQDSFQRNIIPSDFKGIVDNEKELEESTNQSLEDTKPANKILGKRKKTITYKCPHCKYEGKDKYNYKAHVKRHFNSFKKYKCIYCEKKFHSSCDVKRHIQTHTGEKPYLCQECGKAWSNKHKLAAHLKRHQNLRDFHCTQCEKSFFSKLLLKEHMDSVHTEVRRYICDICHVASFKLKKGLMVHKKIHENEKKYHCTLCPAKFNQNPGLHSHMKSKHSIQANKFS